MCCLCTDNNELFCAEASFHTALNFGSLRIRQLSPGMLSINALESKLENCVSCHQFLLKYLCERLKIREICEINHENLVPYGVVSALIHDVIVARVKDIDVSEYI